MQRATTEARQLTDDFLPAAVVTSGEFGYLADDLPSVLHSRRYLFCCGDTYDLLKLLPAQSVDLIITSPPYWGHRTYGQEHNWEILEEWRARGESDLDVPPYEWYREHGGILGLEPLPDWFTSHLVEFFETAKNALKSEGSLWVNLGDTYFARWSSIREDGRQGLGDSTRVRRRTPMGGYRQEKQLLLVPARFAILMQSRRWILRNDVIWHKPNVPPRPEKDRLRLAHEHFFHFVKRPTQGRAKYYYDLSEAEEEGNDVVSYNVRPGEPGHSATFPTDLIEPRIASSCPPKGVVLDPFCGTGRAIVTAVQSGRSGLGFDLLEDFLHVAAATLEEHRAVNETKG